MTRWYRAYEGTVTDSKLGEVALVVGCSRSVAIAAWHSILESACTSNNAGTFTATPRNVAVTLQEPLATVEAVFCELKSLGMIDNQTVLAWTKRQYESDSSTARSKKHRENKAFNKSNGAATLQQQHATPPDTDTDTDTKKEIDAQACAIDLSFKEFWEACPKKVGKGSAENAYRSVFINPNPPTPEQLVAGIKAYAAKVLREKTEPKFIKQPSFWLSEKRWLDEDLQPVALAQIPIQPWVIEHSDDWILWQKAGYNPPAIDRRVDGRLQRGWFFATLRPPIGSLSSVSHETIEAA